MIVAGTSAPLVDFGEERRAESTVDERSECISSRHLYPTRRLRLAKQVAYTLNGDRFNEVHLRDQKALVSPAPDCRAER